MISETISYSMFQSVSAVQKCSTESTTPSNCIYQKEADNTSGKTNMWKNIIKMNYSKNICILICVKNGKYDHNQKS